MKKKVLAVLLILLVALSATAGLTGGKFTGSATPVSLLTVTSYSNNDALQVVIRADPANTGIVYLGGSNVTSAGANAWMFLEAGDAVTLGYGGRFTAKFSNSYLVGTTVAQVAYVTVLTP